ncbi:hypothetical protein E4U53_002925 [Claviceps sorghi]|nr:hypothetical protein E4U53_002925 [Claviceps sorghi]
MKPRRRTDGLPADESEIPETGVLQSQPDSSTMHTIQDSPGPAMSSSSSLTPTASGTAVGGPQSRPTSTIPPLRTAPPQQSALTPPDEPSHQAKKRTLSITQCDETFGTTPPPHFATYSGASLPSISSPEKRQRTSIVGGSVAPIPAPSSNLLCDATASPTPPVMTMTQNSSQAPLQLGSSNTEATRPSHVSKWCELALQQFFTDFADESMDLQIRIAENVLIHENKALIYCKMPWRLKQYWIKKLDDAFREIVITTP